MLYPVEMPTPEHLWYVLFCNPSKERQVAVMIREHLGLRTYLPEVCRHFRGIAHYEVLFPRYLFVKADLSEVALSRINAVPGAVRLISFGSLPQSVPEPVVLRLQERLDALNAQGGWPVHDFQPGDVVRIQEGPLQGLQAVFLGPMKPSERVRVLVDFMGDLRKVDVTVDLLEGVEADHRRRERRTRGKGRKISTGS